MRSAPASLKRRNANANHAMNGAARSDAASALARHAGSDSNGPASANFGVRSAWAMPQ